MLCKNLAFLFLQKCYADSKIVLGMIFPLCNACSLLNKAISTLLTCPRKKTDAKTRNSNTFNCTSQDDVGFRDLKHLSFDIGNALSATCSWAMALLSFINFYLVFNFLKISPSVIKELHGECGLKEHSGYWHRGFYIFLFILFSAGINPNSNPDLKNLVIC